jgi:preprotein translocase subunit YajC
MTSQSSFALALLQGASGPAGLVPMLVMYGGIFAIFYFLLIRPQQKQRKAHEQLVLQLKRGDRIVTAGGIVGEVQHIKAADKPTSDDEITIKSGESRLIIERGRIAKISTASGTVSSGDRVA